MQLGPLGIGEFFALACALVWACAVIIFRRCGEHVPPVALNLYKNTIAFVLFIVTLAVLRIPFFPESSGASDWLILLASGAIGIGIADSLFFASLNRLGAVGTAIVDSLYSPFVVIAAAVYLHEPLQLRLVGGVALMVGAILVGTAEPTRRESRRDRRTVAEGIVLGIISVALMAGGIVLAKPVLTRVDPWWAAMVRLVGGLAVLGLQGALPAHRRACLTVFVPSRVWRFTLPGALVGAYVAMIMWILGFKYAAAGTAGVLNQTNTIFVMILGAIFLREQLTARKLVGIAMAFAGALLVVL